MRSSCASTIEKDTFGHPLSLMEDSPTNLLRDSLSIQAVPLISPNRELQAVLKAQSQQLVAPKRGHLSQSMLQKIITLFAGRRNTQNGNSNNENSKKRSASILITQKLARKPEDLRAASEQAFTLPPKPRLTHAQVIPPILVAGPDHLSRGPSYKDILPAPKHKYVGLATVAKDVCKPTVVQQGFEVVSESAPIPPHRRNNSACKLLERSGDTWSKWYWKNLSTM
ncbi:Nn.00g100740.m01.CDS01 [Neocucurbitaria sp. VM-36]